MNMLRLLLTLITQLHVSPTEYGFIEVYPGVDTHWGLAVADKMPDIGVHSPDARWNKKQI